MKIRLLLPLLFVFVFSSCMPGIRHARQFVNQSDSLAVMVVPPPYTYLYYYPFVPADDSHDMGVPAPLEDSEFLENIDIDRVEDEFINALIQQLNLYPVKVFEPGQFDEFLSFPGPRIIFTLAQTEVIEYDQLFTDRALIDTVLYRQDFLLRNIGRNSWWEHTRVNDTITDPALQVLYSDFVASDFLQGRFRYRGFSSEVYYEYESHMLTLEDVYDFQSYAGRQNARYIYEFLLNGYVEQNARPFLSSPVYFRYNPLSGNFSRGNREQGFILLDE